MQDASTKVMGIIGVVVGVIGLTIVAATTSTLNGQSWIADFTGLGPIVRLLPLAAVGGLIYAAVKTFRG